MLTFWEVFVSIVLYFWAVLCLFWEEFWYSLITKVSILKLEEQQRNGVKKKKKIIAKG